MAAQEAPRKLRILALHGFLQNAEGFRKRIGSMRKALKSMAEFTFLEAPHVVTDAVEDLVQAADGEEGEDKRGWWLTADQAPDGTKLRPALSTQYVGWEETVRVLVTAAREHGPFDGILGFSQGASATALIVSGVPELEPLLGPAPHFKFAVLIGGFLPRDPAFTAKIKDGRPSCRSLHVMGTADELVTMARSEELMECFGTPGEVFEHPGRHGVPCNADFRNRLKTFLSEIP